MKNREIFLHLQLVIFGIFLIFSNSCKKDNTTLPVLSTSPLTNITISDATCGGNIISDGGSAITVRGVCWSIGPTPTIADNKTIDGKVVGSYISDLTNLNFNTTYYVRAYATNNAGTGYGNEISFKTLSTVMDIDSNIYHIVTIGTQVWMVENLKVTNYRDGTPIPNVTDSAEWSNLTTGACCVYENNPSNSTTYGKLYNWYAVNDSRNIAPTGWHVPSHAEWTILTDYLGGEIVAGGKLKEKGLTHWEYPNTGTTNETGFTALPGGGRYYNGAFGYVGYYGYWWSSTEGSADNAYYLAMNYSYTNVNIGNPNKTNGFSVRCLRDK